MSSANHIRGQKHFVPGRAVGKTPKGYLNNVLLMALEDGHAPKVFVHLSAQGCQRIAANPEGLPPQAYGQIESQITFNNLDGNGFGHRNLA